MQPYTEKMDNVTEIINEFGVLVYILHLRCFTDWIVDTNARYNASISLICTVSLKIVILVGIFLANMTLQTILNCKKFCFLVKLKKEMQLENKGKIEEQENSEEPDSDEKS